MGGEVRPQRLDVARPVVRLAERVDEEGHLAQAEPLEEAPAEGDHLHVDVGIVGAKDLDVDLVELAVAAPLRLLVAEHRAGEPHLPRRHRAVLGVGATHAGRDLRAQGDVATALVDEVVHLLGDDVGGLAHTVEHAEVFQQRGDDLPVTRRLDQAGEPVDEAAPAGRLRREDVAHPRAGLELGHVIPRYRSFRFRAG